MSSRFSRAAPRRAVHNPGVYSGNYDFYERERAIREANQQAAFTRQQSMLAKEQRFIERFKTHAAKAAQVQSRIKALDKIDKIELPRKRQVVKFDFRVPPRSGDQVAVIEDLHKSYGSRVIYDGFSLTIRRGERWAVMGKNGAGKTTLLKMIAGAAAPDSGHSPCATAGAAEDQRRKGHSREVAAASVSGHSACNVQRQPPSRGRFCPTETDPADEPFGTFQPNTGPPVPISSAGPPLLQRSRWMGPGRIRA